MKQNKIILIDGYGFIFRAYHSLPPLTRDDGTPVGALYGFTNMLMRLLASFETSHICMVFDSGSKTFRNEIYSDYKANRPPCPEDLIPQFPLIREATEAFNLEISEKVGYEADDLIATIATNAAKENFEVIIVSSDKDLMQLIDDNISMFDAMKNKNISAKEVEEKFMVPPCQVLDVLSLMGDASDNVPGVRGIGPKIAAELISNYGTLENLLENLHEIKQNKRRESLINGVPLAKLSKELITLCKEVPMDTNLDQYKIKKIQPEKLVKFLQEQGFRSLKQRIIKEFDVKIEDSTSTKNKPSKTKNFSQINKIILENEESLNKIIQNLDKINALIIDIEFDKDNKNIPKNIIFSLIIDNNHDNSYKIILNNEINNTETTNLSFFKKSEDDTKKHNNTIITKTALNSIKKVIEDTSILKIGYKIKDIYKFFIQNDIFMTSFEDISVISYIINSASQKSNLRNLIDLNLDENIEENDFGLTFEDLEKNKEPKLFEDENKKEEFYFFKNYTIWPLYKILKCEIFKYRLNFVYERFDRPLISILAKMEMIGIFIDKVKLKQLSGDFDIEIKKITSEIHELSGEEFNIASPKQLSHILFEKLNLPTGKKSKTGSFSTNSDILENLDLAGHEIASKILRWRHISKLKSTYSDALAKNIDHNDRIHTNFSAISTITGRLSSNNPNLQNIPVKSIEGRKIRSSFKAQKNQQLILADYSQIELRVLAYISDIKSLKEAFRQNKDIHSITAAQIFKIDEKDVNNEMRRKAKAINFGIIYGISAFGLAKQLKIDISEASIYIKSYFKTYPGIEEFMQNYQDFAKTNGYVQTITGRKCFISGIESKNPVIKGLAQRLAINAPIQGSAADIIKKAMIDLDCNLRKSNFKTKMILQVHDELILESPKEEVEEVKKILENTMQQAFLLDLPLKVDVKVSEFWN